MSKSYDAYFLSYSGVRLPMKMVGALEPTEIDNRNTFFGVDYDHVITAINVGSIAGLVFTPDNTCYFTGQPSQHLGLGIYNHPAFFNCSFIRVSGLITIVIHVFSKLYL